MEGYKVKMNEKSKEEIVITEQTGEIVKHEINSTPKEEEINSGSVTGEVSELVEDSNKTVQDGTDAGEKSEEDIKDADQKDADNSNENTGEISEEGDKTEADVDEQNKQEDKDEVSDEDSKEELKSEEDSKEEEPEEEEQQSEEKDEVDIEQLKKELAELKAEKEDEAKVKELVDVAQKVEAEYDRVVKGINAALRETLEQYHIPTDKTIQELEKEDPAKAEMAKNLILQAKQALEYNTQQLSKTYQAKEQDVIFSKASRLFDKYEMTNEQAQVAADTFISILQASGLQDLDEDLSSKVELSVAQARFKVPVINTQAPVIEKAEIIQPEVIEVEPKVEQKPEKVESVEAKEEDSKKESKSEINEDDSTKVEQTPEPPAQKVDLSAYKEGIDGAGKAAAGEVDTTDVLRKLASLPFKERQEFLKKNFNLVNKAMREINIKNARNRK